MKLIIELRTLTDQALVVGTVQGYFVECRRS